MNAAYDRQAAALEIFRELGIREREGDTQSVLAEWLWFKGDYRGALEMARDARSLHEMLGVRRYQAHDWLVEGMALASLGHVREAVTLLSDSVKLADQLEHPEWVAHALIPLGVVHGSMRRLRKARQAFTRAADLGDRIGARLWAQLGRVGLGFTALLERKLDEAELSFETVLSGPEELRYPRVRAMTGMGSLELERGNIHLADDWSCSAIEISEAAPYVERCWRAQMLRAHTMLA